MKAVKAVIFDMDGLMIDSERVGEEIYLKIAPQMGIEMTREIYRSFTGTDLNNVLRVLRQHFPEADNEELIRRVEAAKLEVRRAGGVPAKKGLYELFDYLEEKQIRKIVATSSSRELAQTVLEKLDIFSRLDGGVYAGEVKAAKPEPDVFLKALEIAGTAPSEAIILEGSYNGIRAANNAGIDVIMIPDLLPPLAGLSTLAVLEDMTQVIKFLEKGECV